MILILTYNELNNEFTTNLFRINRLHLKNSSMMVCHITPAQKLKKNIRITIVNSRSDWLYEKHIN